MLISGWAVADRSGVLAAGAVYLGRSVGVGRVMAAIERTSLHEICDFAPTALVVERSPVTSRGGSRVDFFGVGLAAGIWCDQARRHFAISEPELVPVADWRKRILGPPRSWRKLHENRRKAAKLAALREAEKIWTQSRTRMVGKVDGPRRVDIAEATCLGTFAARYLEGT